MTTLEPKEPVGEKVIKEVFDKIHYLYVTKFIIKINNVLINSNSLGSKLDFSKRIFKLDFNDDEYDEYIEMSIPFDEIYQLQVIYVNAHP